MKRSKVATLLVLVALLFSLADPPRAAAADALEITLYVTGGILLFVGLVIVGTLLTRDQSTLFKLEPGPPPEGAQSGVAFGAQCRMPDGSPALVCW